MPLSRSEARSEVYPTVDLDELRLVDDPNILHQLLDEIHMKKIHNAFVEQETGVFDQRQLADLLYDIAKLEFDEEKFEILFLRINIKR